MNKLNRVFNAWVTPEANADSVFRRCHVSSIIFDQRIGHGATPLHRQLAKNGFMVMLPPSRFFKLAGETAAQYENDNFYTDYLTRGRSIASPVLTVHFGMTLQEAVNEVRPLPLPAITDIKGFHLMTAVLARYGDIEVPVAVYPAGNVPMRDVTTKHIKNLRGPVVAKGGIISPTGIERVYIDGERIQIRDLIAKQNTPEFTR